jgi:hypothetical protein
LSLETFNAVEELYVARGTDVNAHRPMFTGDVFESVAIPGVQESGMAVVVAHPCSMRATGARLKPKILVAAVKHHEPVGSNAWTRGFFDVTPLPELLGHHLYTGSFDELGRASTSELLAATRLACLSPFGVNLLQQRFIWYLTRFEVPTFQLQDAFAHFYDEVDLMEEWIDTMSDAGVDVADATAQFDTFIRAEREGGRTLQSELRDPQRRSSVRQACLSEVRRIVERL